MAENLSPKVCSISISGFRGVPQIAELELRDVTGNPSSLILCGDNGSGKSSLVDAIEFVLQGRIHRSQSNKAANRPSALSYSRLDTGSVRVEFDDDSTQNRELRRTEDNGIMFDSRAHPAFTLAPLVLRRSDILRFWDTPEVERQLLFFRFFQSPHDLSRLPLPARERLDEIKQERVALKTLKRDTASQLAVALGMDAEAVPAHRRQFDLFVLEHVYAGVQSRRRKSLSYQGKKLVVPARLDELVRKIKAIYDQLSALSREASFLSRDDAQVVRPIRSSVNDAMARIGVTVTEAFKAISPSSAFVDDIVLHVSSLSEVSLSFAVHLRNGEVTSPIEIFSEANLDLLSLLLFLEPVMHFLTRVLTCGNECNRTNSHCLSERCYR